MNVFGVSFICFALFLGLPNLATSSEKNCYKDLDCDKYEFCLETIGGSDCVSGKDKSVGDCVESVGGIFDFPDHNKCKSFGETYQCYNDIGLQCAPAYYMPCVRSYVDQVLVSEETCPTGFSCQERQFSDGSDKVCIPIRYSDPSKRDCKNKYECGYSELIRDWTRCSYGQCSHVVS